MSIARVKIEDYQVVNTLMMRLLEEKKILSFWQKNGSERVKFDTTIKGINWQLYSINIENKLINFKSFDFDKPVFCFIADSFVIFKTKFSKLNPYMIMLSIPDYFIDLKKHPYFGTSKMRISDFLFEDVPAKKEMANMLGEKGIISFTNERKSIHQEVSNYRQFKRYLASAESYLNISRESKLGKIFEDAKKYKLYDLSRNGASFITYSSEFKVGDLLQIKVKLNNLNIKAKVVRTQNYTENNIPQKRIGIKIMSLSKNSENYSA